MSDSTDLHELLGRTTDRIEAPHLGAAALVIARSRRTRARGAVAALAAAAVVTAVVLVPDRVEQVQPAPAPFTPSQTQEPTPDPTEGREERRWDPRKVDAQPVVDSVLPAGIDAPSSAPSVTSEPIDAAILSVDRNDQLLLLSSDGEWRSVPVPERHAPAASLSRDGTRLLVPSGAGAEVWDLATGGRTSLTIPEGSVPWDFQSWRWIDTETVLFDDYEGGWAINVTSSQAQRVAYPRDFFYAIDPSGDVVETGDASDTSVLTRPAVTEDAIAGTTFDPGDSESFRVVVVDRASGEEVASLPVEDFEGNYSNWALRVEAVLGDGTVLLWVAVPGPEARDGWRLVAWDPATDDLEIWTSSDTNPVLSTDFATGLLG